MAEDGAKRGSRLRGAALAALVVVAVVGHAEWNRAAARVRARAKEEGRPRVAVAWAGLSRCMIGEPVAKAEGNNAVWMKLRLVEVGLLDAGGRLGNAPGEWPGRCAAPARALHEAAQAAEDGALDYYALRFAARASPGGTPFDAVSAFADVWGSAVTDYELPVVAPPDGIPPPPTPVAVRFAAGSVPAVATAPAAVSLASSYDRIVEPAPLGTVRLAFRERGSPQARCIFDGPPEKALTRARCGGVGEDDTPLGGEDGAPARTQKDLPASSRIREVVGGFVRADGDLETLVLSSDGKPRWLAVHSSGAADTLPVRCGDEGVSRDDVQLVRDQVLWRCIDEHSTFRLHVVALPRRGEPPPRPVDIGPAPEGYGRGGAHACRTSEALALVATGQATEHDTALARIAFLAGGQWTQLAAVGAPAERVTCRGRTTVVLGLAETSNGVWEIRRDECTPEGCRGARQPLASLLARPELAPEDRRLVDVADLAGKTLVAWKAGRGGVRMRLGLLDELPHVRDVVLSVDKFGQEPFSLGLFSTGEAAVLLEPGDADAILAIRVGADGDVQALRSEGVP
jgi:hypothetical protein